VDESRSLFFFPCSDCSVLVGFVGFHMIKSRITTAFANQYLLGRYVDYRQKSHILIRLIAMSIWKRDAVCNANRFFQQKGFQFLFIETLLFFKSVFTNGASMSTSKTFNKCFAQLHASYM